MNTETSDLGDNLLEVVVRALSSLRKSDQRVAEVLLDRPSEVVDMTLARLASASGVSEPTVIRFCTAIGCEGFRDMRVKLARSLAFARTTSHTAISAKDDLGTIISKIFDFNLSNLNWARSRLNPVDVERAVETLSDARRIEFFGFGASGIVAVDAQQKFPLFGVPCGAPLDSHQMFMTAEMLGPGDVVVAISNTGQTREVINASRVAHEKGASVIVISGSDGPLMRHATIGLVVETLENTDLYTPTVSRLTQLVVIDILSVAVSLRRDAAHHARIAEMKSRLATLRSTGNY
ncbi:MAG: MurR/RpiR family transcriptional regulator [Cypionkella sp.]